MFQLNLSFISQANLFQGLPLSEATNNNFYRISRQSKYSPRPNSDMFKYTFERRVNILNPQPHFGLFIALHPGVKQDSVNVLLQDLKKNEDNSKFSFSEIRTPDRGVYTLIVPKDFPLGASRSDWLRLRRIIKNNPELIIKTLEQIPIPIILLKGVQIVGIAKSLIATAYETPLEKEGIGFTSTHGMVVYSNKADVKQIVRDYLAKHGKLKSTSVQRTDMTNDLVVPLDVNGNIQGFTTTEDDYSLYVLYVKGQKKLFHQELFELLFPNN